MESYHHKATSRCGNNTLIGGIILLDNDDGFLPNLRHEGADLELSPVACYFIGSIAVLCSNLEQP